MPLFPDEEPTFIEIGDQFFSDGTLVFEEFFETTPSVNLTAD